jgi:hypothetical protein
MLAEEKETPHAGEHTMSTARALFNALCDLGNGLERARDCFMPWTDQWLMFTEMILQVDAMVDTLVHSSGMVDDA